MSTEKYEGSLKITAWAEEDRPREKLQLKGRGSLSEAELLAILLGSGSKNETALDLARRILNFWGNDLNLLAKQTIADLTQFKGVGEAKAIGVIAALEFGRRRQLCAVKTQKQIRSSKDAFNIFHPLLGDLPHEEFWVLYLNRSNKIIVRERISIGGVAGTIADIKIIFKRAVELLASGIILIHNHPSGNLKPSVADKQLTEKVAKAGRVLEVAVLDHLVVAESGYYSFADEGIL